MRDTSFNTNFSSENTTSKAELLISIEAQMEVSERMNKTLNNINITV